MAHSSVPLTNKNRCLWIANWRKCFATIQPRPSRAEIYFSNNISLSIKTSNEGNHLIIDIFSVCVVQMFFTFSSSSELPPPTLTTKSVARNTRTSSHGEISYLIISVKYCFFKGWPRGPRFPPDGSTIPWSTRSPWHEDADYGAGWGTFQWP